jgi:two-component system LytT family response regulator
MSTGSLRVLIVDDELLARRRLLRLLGALPNVTIAGELESGEELLARDLSAVDVILLDVNMPGLTGIEALQLLPDNAPYVVFCTAHDRHALPAFDAGAIDYLLKPVEAPRLALALARAGQRDRRARFTAELQRQHTTPLSRLALENARGITLVDPSEVSALTLDGELVSVRTDRGVFLSTLPLQSLHERLPSAQFERVHRRAIVNLAKIDRLEPIDTGGLIAHMKDGVPIEVSRQSARALRHRLGLR